MNKHLDKIKESFYLEAEDKWGFSREEIVAILSQHTDRFKEEEIPEYNLILQNRYIGRMELEKIKQSQGKSYSEILCPICGARTVGEASLFGKYTRTPGWSCDTGGYKHFLWWKINQIRGYQGMPPIDFLNIDWSQYKLHSQTLE